MHCPNLFVSSWIWVANSRVGASTRMVGPCLGSFLPPFKMCTNPGTKNPSVLPEPVLATPTTSRPCSAAGQAWDWITEGISKPARVNCCLSTSGRGTSENLRKGSERKTGTKWQPCAVSASVFFQREALCSLKQKPSQSEHKIGRRGIGRPQASRCCNAEFTHLNSFRRL